MPMFTFSNNGGTRDSGDIGFYQQFILEESEWISRIFHNIKFQTTNGNLLHTKGSNVKRSKAYSTIKGVSGNYSYRARVIQDTDAGTKNRILERDSSFNDFSFPRIANIYWTGGNGSGNSIYSSTSNRLSFFRIEKDGETFYFYPANKTALFSEYGWGSQIVTPTRMRMNEQIPVANSTFIDIDGVSNTKISNTKFRIRDWALQAKQSYPDITGNGWSYTNTNGDTLMYNAQSYEIIERRRVVIYNYPMWDITLSAPVKVSKPTFVVTTSNSEFLIHYYHYLHRWLFLLK